MNAAINGFLLSLSLIVAIGSQNAFVLRQGLLRQHVFWVCLLCGASDALLIAIGVGGFHTVVQQYPQILRITQIGGAAFLLFYGVRKAIAAFRSDEAITLDTQNANPSLKQALLTCLAFTFLNPHVYLDTVFLVGSVSSRYSQHAGQQLAFALGAMAASFTFFFALGYGAGFMRRWFVKPQAWRVLDGVIAVTMFAIAYGLITTDLPTV